jgi:hypothetical protein
MSLKVEIRNHLKNEAHSKSLTSRRIKRNKMENLKKVMVQFDFPNMTAKQYDQVWQDLRAAGHENPKGLIHHASPQTDKGLKIVDVWEDFSKFNEFGQTLMPILSKNGIIPIVPMVSPLYNEYSGTKIH